MIEFHILGATTLRRADGDLDHSFLAGSKRLALFTYLLLARPRGFRRRDKLIALFWPELGQKSARNALSNMLYQIREVIGKEGIESRGTEEICINHEKIWCDAVAFQQALDVGELNKALDLYRGDLLPGFHVTDISNEFMSWVDGQREGLRKQAVEGCWKLSEQAEEAGNRASARRWAQQAVSYADFSEDTYRRLIPLLYRLGDRPGALKAYDEFETLIRKGWDMEPSEKLKRMVESLSKADKQKSNKSASPETTPRSDSVAVNMPDRKRKEPVVQAVLQESANDGHTLKWPRSQWRWWIGAAALLLVTVFAARTGWPGIFIDNESTPAITDRSVAVLPFTYLGAEDSTDYFSMGMTEEILSRLAQVSDLSVISRTSVMQYRDTEKSMRAIGKELGVAAVVEGSVQQDGERVRIHAQLIDAKTDHHLWSERYDREFKDILAIQNEVAAHIAEALHATLLPQEKAHLTARRDVNKTAYHLYLRGQHLRYRRDSAGVSQAAVLFRRAIKNDSTFAQAYAGLALAHFWSGLFGWTPLETAGSDALRSADQALARDSTVIGAYLAKALVKEIFELEWDRSEEAFRRAIKINPGHSELRSEYGWYLLRLGRINEALDQMKRAATADPLSWHARQSLGYAYHCDSQYENAIRELETAISIEPQFFSQKIYFFHALFKQSQRLFQQGFKEEASIYLNRVSEVWIELNNLSGKEVEVLEIFEKALKGQGRSENIHMRIDRISVAPGKKMALYLILGYHNKALDLIEQLLSFKSVVYADPIFDPLRSDPRFRQIVEQRLKRKINPL